MAQRKKRQMSPQHKAAMASGRTMGRTDKAYLDAVESNRPKRGRKRSVDTVKTRLATIEETYGAADPLRRLAMAQERIDLKSELQASQSNDDLSSLEAEFVKVAKDYAASKKLSYDAFREVGVKPEVLRKAGITR